MDYTQIFETRNHQNIPEQLQALAWMGTRFKVGRDGKVDKPPYCVKPRRVHKADKTSPKNHATFEEAVAAYDARRVHAIGIVLSEDDPITIADIDHALDPETGEMHPRAAEIVERFDTYQETSVSGTGIHIVMHGKKPGPRCKKELGDGVSVEIYDQKRFVVVTGNGLGNRKTIRNCQEELDDLYAELFPERRTSADRPTILGAVDLEDSELLERARHSRTGAKFRKLFDHGDIGDYESHSSADFAL